MTNKANTYPDSGINPTLANADTSKQNLGVCFSGGGSRALTCAWGQLLGISASGLADKPRYISSVSGGTWASSIYTFLPDNISSDELLGSYYPPAKLSLTGDNNTFDVNTLGPHSLGHAPKGTSLEDLIVYVATFLLLHADSHHKWLWASIVAEFILEPFDLRFEGKKPWISTRYFSLSSDYANRSFPEGAPPLTDFCYARDGRPFIIMNDNIMERVGSSGISSHSIVQIPNQATPVSAGALGRSPVSTLYGGGTVESYAYNSTLAGDSAMSPPPVTVEIEQPYSLIDSVSTSSAFFANLLAEHLQGILADSKERAELVRKVHDNLEAKHKKLFRGKLDEFATELESRLGKKLREKVDGRLKILGDELESYIDERLVEILDEKKFDPADIIPTYNYWPIRDSSKNEKTQYTDGGTLDNLGVLGILGQTDSRAGNSEKLSLVVFDNTSTPLTLKHGKIIAGSQAAPLFGIKFDVDTGNYGEFSQEQKDPTCSGFEATSLIQVFDNSKNEKGKTPFDLLVEGLYAANCGATPGESPVAASINTQPAFYEFTATTIDNLLANVSADRTVDILYIQNAKMLDWQNLIGDKKLRDEIIEGQKHSIDLLESFEGFPNYSTFLKIGLEAKESNALSQMWAWALADDASSLKSEFSEFVHNA
jgi:hypothetical protein